MNKKLLAVLASVFVVTATAGTVTALPSYEANAQTNAFDACVDIASDSWVSNGCGWRVNRYGDRSITSDTIGATLEAYAGNPGPNALIWGGGGPSSQGFGSLYTGGDFAVSFAGDVGGSNSGRGFALVVDQFSLWVSTTAIKIGYDLQAGTFGDAMSDYTPQQWTTDLDILHTNGSETAQWLVQESVSVSGVVKIEAYVTTDSGVTSLGVRVGDKVVTATTEMERVTGVHTAIVSWGGKVYSESVLSYLNQIDEKVASLDADFYTGATKVAIDNAVMQAKQTILGEQALTKSVATSAVSSVQTAIDKFLSGGSVDEADVYLSMCKDIADDSWVNGGNGWMAGRYGGRTITDDTIGVKLGAYSWEGSAHWLIWGGGGFSTSEGLYTGGNFAVSFAAEMTSSGFAIVIDQFSMWVSPTAIKIGYDEQCGVFGDAMPDYAPAYWTTDLDILHGRGSDVAKWFVQETVSLSGVVDVDAFVITDNGVTTLGIKVGDEVVTATTGRTRVTGCHAGIMSQNGKVYSQKATAFMQSIYDMVDDLDESVYTGENKTKIDLAVKQAEESLWSEATLTSAKASSIVSTATELLLGYLADGYIANCKDIANTAWATDSVGGWVYYADTTKGINDDSLSYTLPQYNWSVDHFLYWAGGTSGEGNLYKENDDFAIKFLADIPQDGFVLRVDNFAIYIHGAGVWIGYNYEPGDGDTTTDDFSRTFWVINPTILEERGDSHTGGWIVKKDLEISGINEIAVSITTNEAGITTFIVEVGDARVATTTSMTRKYLDRCILLAGYEAVTLYSTKITDAQKAVETLVAGLGEDVCEEYKDSLSTFVVKTKKSIWELETYTKANIDEILLGVQNMVNGFDSFVEYCTTTYVESDYSTAGWAKLSATIEEVCGGYFTCEVSQLEEYVEVATARLDAVLTLEEEEALNALRATEKAEIEAIVLLQADYSEESWARIQAKIAEYMARIDLETDTVQIELLAEACLADLRGVPTILQEMIAKYTEKIDEFFATLSQEDYSTENWNSILTICETAKAELALLTDESAMQSKYASMVEAIENVEKVSTGTESEETDSSSASDSSTEEQTGCGSNIRLGGLTVACVALLITVFAVRKRKTLE